jgi:hypothetical protein
MNSLYLPIKISFPETEASANLFNTQYKDYFSFEKKFQFSEKIQFTKKRKNSIVNATKIYKLKKAAIQSELKEIVNTLIAEWVKFANKNAKYKSRILQDDFRKIVLDKFNQLKILDINLSYEIVILSIEGNNLLISQELDSESFKEIPKDFTISALKILACNDARVLTKNEKIEVEKFLNSVKKKYLKKFPLIQFLFQA